MAPQNSPARSAVSAVVALLISAVLIPAATAAEGSGGAASFDWRAFLAPFHTVTLHLPIGFVTIVVILEIYWFFRKSEPLRPAIGLILWASAFSVILVTMLGFFRASGGGYEPVMVAHHQNYGVAVTVVTAIIAILHSAAFRGERSRKGLAAAYRLLLVVDVALLVIAGHGGGNLTHGSKYLVEGAPDWVKEWIEKKEGKTAPNDAAGGDSSAGGVFSQTIRPVLEKKCFSCHGPEKQKGDYRMDTKEGLITTGESELPPIVVGKPLESYLVELITLPEEDDFVMPPEGKERLTPEEILTVMRWIWDGADTGDSGS